MGNDNSTGGDSCVHACDVVQSGPIEVHASCANPQPDCPTPSGGPGVVTVYEGSVGGLGDVTVSYVGDDHRAEYNRP